MPKSIIAEGKTTNEAISNGLKQLNVSKESVDIKILENSEKRSFFSILAPRVVKVEMKLKANVEEKSNVKKHTEKEIKTQDEISKQLEEFIKDFIRGYMDGDGGISYWIQNKNTNWKKFELHFCGTTEMIYGIIISHQYGIKIVTRYRKQGSYHTYLDPRPIINTIKKIKDILQCGKSQSNTNSIYNTIKMFVEEWILPQ